VAVDPDPVVGCSGGGGVESLGMIRLEGSVSGVSGARSGIRW